MTLRLGTTVTGVEPLDSGAGEWRVHADDGSDEDVDLVVNALWNGRLAIDVTAGLTPEPPWTHRYRNCLFVRTRSEQDLASALVAIGPFGDVKNYNGRDFYLSWYPVGLVAEGNDLELEAPAIPSGSEAEAFIARVRAALEPLMPGVGPVLDDAESVIVHGGFVFARGRGRPGRSAVGAASPRPLRRPAPGVLLLGGHGQVLHRPVARPRARDRDRRLMREGRPMESADSTPLVTALVPTYNGAAFIRRTLDSLAAQTWPNLEILVGDDRSTDDTLDVVHGFAEQYPDTVVVERDDNLGWLRNSNDLMARARGELMFFAFHDDVVAPTYVEELVGALAANERAVLAFSDMEVHELDGTAELHVFDELEGLTSAVERGRVMVKRPGFWWVPNRGLFRSSAFAEVGGIHPNEQGEYSADWTWLLGLSLIGEFVRVPEVLCTKYYLGQSLSKRWPHDSTQLLALRRSGIAEIRRSSLSPARKAVLNSYLWRRVYGRRLPRGVKGVFRRLGW